MVEYHYKNYSSHQYFSLLDRLSSVEKRLVAQFDRQSSSNVYGTIRTWYNDMSPHIDYRESSLAIGRHCPWFLVAHIEFETYAKYTGHSWGISAPAPRTIYSSLLPSPPSGLADDSRPVNCAKPAVLLMIRCDIVTFPYAILSMNFNLVRPCQLGLPSSRLRKGSIQ